MTFDEFYEFGKSLHDKKWLIYATGGNLGENFCCLYSIGKTGYKIENFRESNDGKCFDVNLYKDKQVISSVTYVNLSCLNYRFEIYNEKPLQIIIEWKSNVNTNDSEFLILEEIL